MSIRSLTLLVLTLILTPVTTPAQVLYGSLTGNVTDKSGAGVPNAKVEALNVSTNIAKQTTTDERGVFLFQDVQAGVYKLTVSAPSFAITVESGMQVAENSARRVDVQLQVANLGQTVTISADVTVLQTERADVNHQVTGEEVTDLPT